MMDRAQELIATQGARAAFKMAMDAREGVTQGRYCECEQPSLNGDALMCGHCLLRNRGQEIRRLHRIVDAHSFVPGKLRGRMCAMCTHWEDDPRHHGQPAVGTTSWGESVQGLAP